MLKRLLAVLLLVPLLDALVLVFVAGILGWQLTVAIVVLTALIGLLFVRAEGRHTIQKIESAVARGDPPTDGLMDGALLLVAGAFLLTPGLVTDTLGLILVVPPTRYVVRSALKRWVVTPYIDRKTGGFATGNVYSFGFPSQTQTSSSQTRSSDDVYDIDSDAYQVDIEDDDSEH